MLQSDQTHYQHNDSINEIYSVLAKVVKDDFRREIEESPYPFYGLELDEATDKADKSILIIFIRFINGNGELRCSFLGVQQLQRTDAEGIFQAALATLAEHNLPTNKMVGLATYGASVMTGIHQGVSTRYAHICCLVVLYATLTNIIFIIWRKWTELSGSFSHELFAKKWNVPVLYNDELQQNTYFFSEYSDKRIKFRNSIYKYLLRLYVNHFPHGNAF